MSWIFNVYVVTTYIKKTICFSRAYLKKIFVSTFTYVNSFYQMIINEKFPLFHIKAFWCFHSITVIERNLLTILYLMWLAPIIL